MNNLKKVLLALFVLSITPILHAQNGGGDNPLDDKDNLKKATLQANAFYEAKEYYFALEAYKKAFGAEKNRKVKAEITFRQAECYRMMNDCKNAANYYKRAVKMKYDQPIAQLRYADMLKCQGEYEEAITEYESYKQQNPGDKRGEDGITSCKEAVDAMKNPSLYMVNNMKDLNSKGYDYQAAYAGKRSDDYSVLLISSTRDENVGKKDDGWIGQPFSDIYLAEADRKGAKGRGRNKQTTNSDELTWSSMVPLDEMINTKDHEGVLCFDSKMKTMYFTVCENVKNMKLGCMIYETRKMGQSWQEPQIVLAAPDSTTSVGHPSLSPDDKFLYVSGELPGSLGGKDLWVTTYDRRGKKWGDPKNLGPLVNTAGDELYPFAHDDGYLYFSSNGHGGMGGQDIFRVKVDDEGMPTGKIENMQYPINSSRDDIAIQWEKGAAKKGFMSSDRDGGRGGFDIYSVILIPLKFTMDGTVVSSKDGTPVPQATVRLDGTDGTSIVVNTDKDGHFTFTTDQLNENTQYKINVEKKKFLTNTADFTTIGVDMSSFEFVPSQNIFLHGMKVQVKLDPIEVPIVLPNVFFDLAKWDLRSESSQSLDSVVAILNNNPNITILMRSHTDYRDSDARNKALSQKRADTCVSYLISKGIAADRLKAVGMGEDEPFVIPAGYKGYGAGQFPKGTRLTETYIKTLPAAKQEVANQLNRRTDFKVDKDDYVPGKTADSKPGDKSANKPKQEGKPKGQFYTCEARDSFGKIAQQNGLNVVQLKNLNGGLRGVRVFEGLMLKITPDGDYTDWDNSHYQVQMRDTMRSIADKLGISEKELREMNDGIRDRDLMPGMWLEIN